MSSLPSSFLSLPMFLVLPSVVIIDTASAADTLKGDAEVILDTTALVGLPS